MKKWLGLILFASSLQAAPTGYIRSWLICGPFEKSDVESPAPGEAALNPKAGDAWMGRSWKNHASIQDMIDLSSPLVMEYRTNAAAYAFVRINSPTDQPAFLRMGSDDSLRLWLNGEEILSNPTPRPYKEGDEKLQIYLRSGWNSLLLKVGNYYGSWGYGCGVFGKDGKPLEGVTFDPPPTGLEILPVRKVTVSSQEGKDDPAFRPRNLVDGDRSTRWASEQGEDLQRVILDFGASQALSSLSIFWENAYAASFRVDLSDDRRAWKTVHEDQKFQGGEASIAFPQGSKSRYLRVQCLKRGTPWGYSIWEMVAVGKPGGAAVSGAPEEAVGEAGPPPIRAVSARASSHEGGHTPSLAVDGIMETYWGSRHQHDPEWIELDLGKARGMRRFVLHWEKAYAKAFVLEVSKDQKTWTQVHQTDKGAGKTENIPLDKSVQARYVRLTGSARGTAWGYSLREVQIFEE